MNKYTQNGDINFGTFDTMMTMKWIFFFANAHTYSRHFRLIQFGWPDGKNAINSNYQ